jgi:hypothetical protein
VISTASVTLPPRDCLTSSPWLRGRGLDLRFCPQLATSCTSVKKDHIMRQTDSTVLTHAGYRGTLQRGWMDMLRHVDAISRRIGCNQHFRNKGDTFPNEGLNLRESRPTHKVKLSP